MTNRITYINYVRNIHMVIIGILFTIGESFVFKNISILYLMFCTLEYKCTHNSLIKKDLFI